MTTNRRWMGSGVLSLLIFQTAAGALAADVFSIEQASVVAAAGPQQGAGGEAQMLSSAGEPAGGRRNGIACSSLAEGYWGWTTAGACVQAGIGHLGAVLLLLTVLRRRHRRSLRKASLALGLAALWMLGPAAPPALAIPTSIHYQGRLLLNGQTSSDAAYFKFALIDSESDAVLWSTDGKLPEPTASQRLALTGGHFSVQLGAGAHADSSPVLPLPVAALAGKDLLLRVWVSGTQSGPFIAMEPDLPFASVPYAFDSSALQGKGAADFATAGHKHAAADVTSGSFGSERIADGSLTGADLAPAADITTSGTLRGATVDASSQLRIGGVAVTASAAALNEVTGNGETALHQHDARYRTETELSSTTAGQGASLIGVQGGTGFSATNVQGALAELKSGVGVIKTLQSAYTDGNSLVVSAAEGELSISDTETGSFDTLTLSKTASPVVGTTSSALHIDVRTPANAEVTRVASQMQGISIDMSGVSGATTAGVGISIQMNSANDDPALLTNAQIESTIPTGKAPLLIDSTTVVTNLNADLLDGQSASAFMPAATDNWVNTTGDTMTGVLGSSVTTGTAPFTINSTTLVGNLNADLLDGQSASAFMPVATDNWVNTTGDTLTGVLASSVTTGTAPFTVSSTTLVGNLNADLLDGQSASAFMLAATDNWVNTTGDIMTGQITFDAPQGTPPFEVASETLVENLNVEMLGGKQAGDFLLATQAGDFMPATADNWVNTDGDTLTGDLNLNAAELNFGTNGVDVPSDASAGWKLRLFDGIPDRDYGLGIAPSELWIVSDGKISFRPGSGYQEKVTIDPAGNVGIGRTAPGAKLDVAGMIRTSSLGTTDNTALELMVNGQRVLRLEPGGGTPNVLGGQSNNGIGVGVIGATIAGGGGFNQVIDDFGTIGGGSGNVAGFPDGSTTNSQAATVAGGSGNVAVSLGSVIGGGVNNVANGDFSMIPGGTGNRASGGSSLAAGRRAKAEHGGSFVWADSTNFDFSSQAANEFSARATGGVRFVSAIDGSGNATAGVQLPAGGSAWASLSDRNAKEGFAEIDARQVAAQVAALPIQTWSYKSQDRSIRHIGPMAQDFRAAFAVGEDETHITTLDADGVALAAIQGLYRMVEDKDQEIAELKRRNAAAEARLAALERRMEAQSSEAAQP